MIERETVSSDRHSESDSSSSEDIDSSSATPAAPHLAKPAASHTSTTGQLSPIGPTATDFVSIIPHNQPITFSDWFGGVGHASYAWSALNYTPDTYFDSSSQSAFAYFDANPGVSQ